MSAFVVSQIKPSLNIDSSQRLIFGLEGAPEPLGSLKIDNIYVPLIGSPSVTHFDLRNNTLSGFRLCQETALGDTHGKLKIQSFLNGSAIGTDLMTFNEDGTIEFSGSISASLTLTGAVTGSGIGTIHTTLADITTSQISDFSTSVLSFSLDQFLLPETSLNLNNQKITDLSAIEFANTSLDTKIRFFTNNTPDNPFDQSGMGYLATAGTLYHCPIGQSHLFFTGANGNLPVEINANGLIVSGNGYSPTDFRKIVFFQKYQTTNPHQSYSHGILLTGGDAPDLNFDLRAQIGSSSGAFSWCYGTSGATSTELMRLSPSTGLDLKNNKIVNLLDPAAPQDAATKAYVDSSISSGIGAITITLIGAVTGSGDASAPISTTLTPITTSQITNFSSSVEAFRLDQFSAPASAVNLNSQKIINLALPTSATDAASKSYVDSVAGLISNPYSLGNSLTFNWSYAASSNPSLYSFIHNFTDSQQDKTYVNSVLTAGRGWSTNYTLIGNSDLNGTYQVSYKLSSGSPIVPFKIDVFPFAYTNITLQATNVYVQGILNMGGYEVKNALNPTTAQSLTTKSYVDTSISALNLTLTGAVTGSGNVSGSLATSFSNNQTVTGGDTQTFTFTPSLATAFFQLFNSNTSATTQMQVGNSTNYLACGYAAAGAYAFFNTNNINSIRFSLNGLTQAALNSTGLGLGILTPTLAKLQISGGVQNITGEETAIRVIGALSNVKIELQSNAAGGHLYELRSASAGSFDITDRTASATRFVITSLGNIGIGALSPNSLLQFPNALNYRIITLNEATNNIYQYTGFGYSAAGLWYSVSSTSLDHLFVAATSGSSANVVGRITGAGDFVSSGTLYGRRSSGAMYMDANVIATSLTANVWTKLAGTTSASGLSNNFSISGSNRLVYTGTRPFNGMIMAAATLNFSAGGGGTTRSISLFKNGSQVTPSLMSEDIGSGANVNMTTFTFISLATNDYIELWCRSSATSNVTPSSLIMIPIDC